MKIGKHWKQIRVVFQETLASSLHYAVATVNEDGSPHVTPIGALFLRGDRTGFYFDVFTSKMSANLARNPRACVLAVNSSVPFWQANRTPYGNLRPLTIKWKPLCGLHLRAFC